MKRVIVLMCLFFIQYIFSQSDYREGYIVNKSNDTIHGFINYKINSNKYEEVEFKSSLSSNSIQYLPTLIKGYGFKNNEYFKSFYIKDKKYEKKLFIENLVLGKIKLYKLYNDFFLAKDSIFVRLDNDVRTSTENDVSYSAKTNRYIGVLRYLISDCKGLKNKAKNIKYFESNFVEIINEYNLCKGGDVTVFKQNKPYFKLNTGLFVGYNSSTITNDRLKSSNYYFEDSNTSRANITYGVFFELSSPRIIERISFYTGIAYNSLDFYEYKLSGDNLLELSGVIKQLIIPIAFRYTFPERRITPYITLGIQNLINIENTRDWSIEFTKRNEILTSLQKYQTPLNSIGFTSGLGFKTKINNTFEGFLDINYQYLTLKNNSDPKIRFYKNNISTIQLLVGIRL